MSVRGCERKSGRRALNKKEKNRGNPRFLIFSAI